jgi:fermentation-respiration switch protein FrsA (DUF1100 family)
MHRFEWLNATSVAEAAGAGATTVAAAMMAPTGGRVSQDAIVVIAQQVKTPFLVVHGKDDGIIPPEEAETLYSKLGSAKKMLKIFDADEGGAEHCQVDDRQAGVNYIADWLAENVFAAKGK